MVFRHADRAAPRSVVVFLVVVFVAVGGCATTGNRASVQRAYSPETFLIEARARAPEIAAEDIVVPFQVTAEMVAIARDVTSGAQSDFEKADRLMASLLDEDGFGLEYDNVSTSIPEVTLERGYGNCLALTSIFIGLAREIGLTAYYVDASDRIHVLRREQNLIVDSGHIAGGVRTEKGFTLVDYDGHFSHYRTFNVIDDITALAHYYNNLGFELMTRSEGDASQVPWQEVRRNFEMATQIRPDFTRAYNNLGVAYTRLGDQDAAEAAYLTAIEIEPGADAAYHNLGNLEMHKDNYAVALTWYDKALELRGRNPYLLYHRGMAQYQLRDMVAAEQSFKRSISMDREFIEPRNLLAQVLYQQGKVEEAEKVQAAAQKLLADKRQ